MNTEIPNAVASSRMRRCADFVSELAGWYRIQALARGNVIATGAYVKSPSRLCMGRDVHIQRGAMLHAGGKAWSGFCGHIRLADGVRIGPYCALYGAGGIDIGEHTHLGPGVKLMSQSGRHSDRRESSSPDYNLESISIGSGTWLGAGAVVLGGSRIGRCASIGPNSVVSGVIPDYAVVVGNPGRVMFYNTGKSDG